MRIAFHIGVTMMFPMNGDPFLGVDSGPKPELHTHGERDCGMQINAAMSQSAVQINAGGKRGKLNNDDNSDYSV